MFALGNSNVKGRFTRHWMNSVVHWGYRNFWRHRILHYIILMLKKVIEHDNLFLQFEPYVVGTKKVSVFFF